VELMMNSVLAVLAGEIIGITLVIAFVLGSWAVTVMLTRMEPFLGAMPQ
jgi:hypothetical protein